MITIINYNYNIVAKLKEILANLISVMVFLVGPQSRYKSVNKT